MMQEAIVNLPVAAVRPNPDQPRRRFPEDQLKSLALSIDEQGLQQPILVRQVADAAWEIVAGERRWRAHKMLGRTEVPAIVRAMSPAARDLAAIVENLQRQDISAIEEAWAVKRLLDAGLTLPELGRRIGLKDTMRLVRRQQLLQLREDFQELVLTGHLPEAHAHEMARLDHAGQGKLFERLKRGKLKLEELRAAVDGALAQRDQPGMFGDRETGRLTPEEERAASTLERQVEQIAKMVCAGFDRANGVDIASKVPPHRAAALAERLELIQRHISPLVRQLRRAKAQVELLDS